MEKPKKERKERKKKVRDVPIATIKMDKPIYTVPLQTTMALNFYLDKPTNQSTGETSPKNTMDNQQSLDYGDNLTRRTSGSYDKDDKNYDSKTSYDESNSKNIQNLNIDDKTTSKNIKYTNLNDENNNNYKGANKHSEGHANEYKSGRIVSESYGDDKDGDSDGELDVDRLAERAKKYKSTFKHMTWRLPSPKQFIIQPSCTIIFKDSEIVVMIKTTCTKESTLQNDQVHCFMLGVAENCAQRLKQMMHMSLPDLTPRHMESLPLNDQQTAKTHLLLLSQQLEDQINLSDVAYRYQTENIYIGTYVSNKVKKTKQCSIGKVGVVAILSRKNKYATIDAFSKQLCRHIAATKPSSLGYVSEADIRKINKRGTVKIIHLQKDQLMLQNFSFDSTIIVAEAARRSFVKIEDFLLFH